MSGLQRSGAVALGSAAEPLPISVRYSTIDCHDATQLSEQTREWNFEMSQLVPGNYRAHGGVLDIDGVSLARISFSHTTLHRGYAPSNMVALIMPSAGSGPGFADGRLIESGDCLTLSDGELEEGITHGNYVDNCFAFDVDACRARLEHLTGGSIGVAAGANIAAPGADWNEDMLGRIDWLMSVAATQSHGLTDPRVCASIADHMLAALARFDLSEAVSNVCGTRASRRAAVRRALDFIHETFSEPLRLSELCRRANAKVRSLEYGFREVTGLTPIAYIRSLRLNAVRKALLSERERSITEIAMDSGFWHLGQFASDYRRFFGETPTQTRQRCAAIF